MKSVAGRSAWPQVFLLVLFASACCASDCSKLDRPFCTVCLQAFRSEATASNVVRSISMAFKSLLQTSSYRSRLGSACQLTVEKILGDPAVIHAYYMPQPTQRLCFSSVYILGIPALFRTLLFVTLSCQVMCSMRRRQRMWNALNFFSCRVRRVLDLVSYRRVPRAQALQTLISVCSVSLSLVHTLFVRLGIVVTSLPMRLLISMSRARESEIWISGRRSHGQHLVHGRRC